MRRILIVTALFTAHCGISQSSFPQDWSGNWKGELLWYKTGQSQPQQVPMELHIHRGDSAGTWSWQLIYGAASEDNRPYTLMAKDNSGIHWAIDENNGIVLDQYWVANKLSGAFTVMNSTIINNYWMEDDALVAEFYSLGAQPVSVSGKGTEESPSVSSYRVSGYQKAVLKRVQ